MVKKSSIKGSVFILVLIFMLVMSVMVLNGGLVLLSHQRDAYVMKQYETIFFQAEKILKNLELEKEIIPKNLNVHYKIEDLGIQPCIRFANLVTAHYYLILLTVEDKHLPVRIQLESIIAKPENVVAMCYDSMRIIQAGRQAWREVM